MIITYVLGRKREAPSLSRKHVCESFSETVDASDDRKWPHADLHIKIQIQQQNVRQIQALRQFHWVNKIKYMYSTYPLKCGKIHVK